jgi:hypothetical protein
MPAQADKISNLPDEILTRILSILPIKESIRTSILSSRWISVWTCLPELNLTSPVRSAKDKEELFRKFIDSVLVDHKMPYLHDVCIISPLKDGSIMKSWISSAIESNISSLKICAFPKIIPVLPQSLFSGCSLVQLGLYMAAIIDFPVASATYFPKLKVLCLHNVKFNLNNDSATYFISSCPVLEKLKISTYKEQCFRTLNVSSTCLKYFSLRSVSGGEVVNFDYVP